MPGPTDARVPTARLAAPDPADLLRRLTRGADCLTHVEHVAARAGSGVDWPEWVRPELRAALTERGVARPWSHQAAAAALARAGRHVVVSTGTASGKSLAYHLPVLTTLAEDPRATAIYVAPTKALAADQLRVVSELAAADMRPSIYDGDTPIEEREWVRTYSRFVLTNPDMLHRSVMPRHAQWSTFLRRLRYVVIDECHAYRGVFGSHVAHAIRRLRRVCRRYGTAPVFILASATMGDPATTASRLTGLDVAAVTEDGSPRGGVTFALWEPPLLPGVAPDTEPADPSAALPAQRAGESAEARRADRADRADGAGDGVGLRRAEASGAGLTRTEAGGAELTRAEAGGAELTRTEAGGAELTRTEAGGAGLTRTEAGGAGLTRAEAGAQVRVSALRQTADLLADGVAQGSRTLAFVRSRRGAEVVAAMARRTLREAAPDLIERVAAYRAGYLREERRAIEQALLSGHLLGLASTNALELGVDLVGLDTVILAGYPGTLASMWQQAGRAGRGARDALCIFVARDDPLDTYLVHHPQALFGRPVEATVLDPTNPYVLGPHLCCAAAELPLTEADLPLFGPGARATLDRLVTAGALRQRPTGWYWTGEGRPDVDLRGTGGAPISIVEESTGRLLGTVDGGSAHAQVHTGAVHLHQGRSYVVDALDLEDCVALVHAEEPDWTTHARDVTSLTVETVRDVVDAGPIGLFLGDVDVTNQVVSYQRRRIATGQVIDTRPLDLPARQLHTTAVWWTISPQALAGAGIDFADVPGALHAAEHAAIGLLPLVATCDRWDIGGLSTALHPDTEAPTVFVYDGHPGGAGFAERAYHVAAEWLRATRDAIKACACERGCPSCVHSPKCGNGNDPLSKAGAIRVLDTVLAALATAPAGQVSRPAGQVSCPAGPVSRPAGQ